MYARVSSYEGGSPDEYDAALDKTRDMVKTRLSPLEGYRGVLAFADRSKGKAYSVTLWETEDAMEASEEEGNEVREEAAAATAGKITDVDRCEVTIFELQGL